MKTKLLMITLGLLFATHVWSQKANTYIPLIGESAPSFTAESTNGILVFPDDFGNKWKILFSHPADFTPVCSTEILEMANEKKEFDKLNTQLVVVSTDELDRHYNWKKSLETVDYDGKGKQKITFPLVDDHSMAIANAYGMIHPGSGSTKDVRGVFIIDPSNKIRALFFYPITTGRNIEEIKRTLVALQVSDKQNVVTPANWEPGKDVMIHAPKSSTDLAKNDPDVYQLNWYMNFKKGK